MCDAGLQDLSKIMLFEDIQEHKIRNLQYYNNNLLRTLRIS
ncbi:15534_t:CDS:2 [Cetraspora pellucida]|uniref:15534_t:CDS:1 n=1 Tax=Cetraspora pellucida TaxID=1433469 RepID=A0A9N9DT98_9GLOM|nr:15534_t:CDS:2 [Cetraspora pellucida]